ncbi:MATE family efflux transporter [Paenibacillus filicis]|uniref:MATE family efflux transporter n=1 Tax=Paenibacillus gyeongsangnamensis TaxID=3388067 RepID=A0ABT4Q722_9BACL|nr:lipid II flippase MurJ [Paenibacillus filicis]MCZ8512623.1 MATE family efflux transporter [Paenibacillus filicis]
MKTLLDSIGKLKKQGRMLRTINTVAVINLTLAIAAFVKDLLSAAYLGTSTEADAFTLAYFLPDTLGNNLFASALGVACVPMFAAWNAEKRHSRLLSGVGLLTRRVLMAGIVLCVIMLLFGRPMLRLIGSGLAPERLQASWDLYVLMTPIVILLPLAFIASAFLQVRGSFAPPAFAPLLYHIAGLLTLLFLLAAQVPKPSGVYGISGAILIGTAAQALFMGVLIRRIVKAYPVRQRNAIEQAGLKEDMSSIARTFWPYLLILISTQLILAVERGLASGLGTGTISGLNYAYRLSQFPNWVFVSAVTVVILPKMSQAWNVKDREQLSSTLRRAVQFTLLITVPAALILCMLRHPIITLLFVRGSFDFRSEEMTSTILAGYSLAMVGQAITLVYLRLFMTIGKMTVPLFGYFAAAAVNIGLDLCLIPVLGAAGLGYGALGGSLVGALVLAWSAQRFLHSRMS